MGNLPWLVESLIGVSATIALILGCVFLLIWFLMCRGLAKSRTSSDGWTAIEEEVVDLEARRQVRPWLVRLGAMGFTAPRLSRDQNWQNPGSEKYEWRLVNPDSKSIAVLRVIYLAGNNKASVRL